MSAAELLLGCFNSSFVVFVPVVFVIGTCKGLSDPTVSSAYSTVAPGDAKARSSLNAMVEVSWGLASFVGLPAFGALLSVSPRAPFLALALALALAAVPLSRLAVPPSPAASPQAAPDPSARGGPLAAWRPLCRRCVRGADRMLLWPLFVACLATSLLSECATITFGMWLRREQRWGLRSVAAATFAIGTADLVAEAVLICAFTCRGYSPFSFARGWLGVLLLFCAALPPLCAGGALPGILGFGALFLAHECALVSLISCTVALGTVRPRHVLAARDRRVTATWPATRHRPCPCPCDTASGRPGPSRSPLARRYGEVWGDMGWARAAPLLLGDMGRYGEGPSRSPLARARIKLGLTLARLAARRVT